MERKQVPFLFDEEKGLDPENRTFQGFAAVMGNLDDGGDIIKKGAFKKTLQEMGDRVKVYKYHDFRTPIGKPLDLKEVPRSQLPAPLRENYPNATGGLYVKGYISETRDGNDVLTLMRDRVVEEMSIGYETLKEEEIEIDDGQKARHLIEIRLLDVSPVPLAMNPAAIITDVKEMKVEESETHIRVPVPGEEGKHDGHRIRTITISEDEGIKALFCGECKKNITYIFEKKKGWTVPKAVAWVKEHSKEAEIEPETKGVVSFQDLPLTSEDRAWEKAAAERRVRSWAGGGSSVEDMNWGKYRRAFIWFDSDAPDQIGSYKLQIGDVINGRLMGVPRGIFACAVVLQGGRGGANVGGDTEACKRHIARYYKKMDREAPFKTLTELFGLLSELVSDSIVREVMEAAAEPPQGALTVGELRARALRADLDLKELELSELEIRR